MTDTRLCEAMEVVEQAWGNLPPEVAESNVVEVLCWLVKRVEWLESSMAEEILELERKMWDLEYARD